MKRDEGVTVTNEALLAEMREVGNANQGFRSGRLLLTGERRVAALEAAAEALLQRFEYCDRGTKMRVPLSAVDAFREVLSERVAP